MKQIHENFRKFLTEVAKDINNFVEDDLIITIEEKDYNREVAFYINPRGRMKIVAELEINFLPMVSNSAVQSGMDTYGNCLGAYQVIWSEAQDNYGPLLYDVAIEYATQFGNGLTCDRAVVSEDAYKVWEYYLKRRNDVEVFQLDDLKNTLTPTEKDNCMQYSAMQNKEMFGKEGFPNSPLSKVYKKTDLKVMKQLKELGRLKIEGGQDAMDFTDYGGY